MKITESTESNEAIINVITQRAKVRAEIYFTAKPVYVRRSNSYKPHRTKFAFKRLYMVKNESKPYTSPAGMLL